MTLRAWLVLLAALAFAAGPVLVPGFGGFDPGAFPVPQDDPPIQPAGWAFAIWGPIYLWLVVSAGYGVWRRAEDPGWDRTRVPLILSLAVGAVWLAVALRSPVWAMVLIWAMWAGATVALWRAPARDRAGLAWPLGLYAGWLTAASVVATGLCLAGYGWLDERTAAAGGLLVATVLAAGVAWRTGNPAYAAAVIWAFAGIAAANQGTAGMATPGAVRGAVAAAALVAIACAFGRARARRKGPPSPEAP